MIQLIIYVVDDEQLMMQEAVEIIRRLCPRDAVYGYTNPEMALRQAQRTNCDVAFLDIQIWGSMSGIELAKALMALNPQVNIIFVTAYDSYARAALELHVSGFLSKPIREEDVRNELAHLRYPIGKPEEKRKRLTVKCFGNFSASVDGRPLVFERSKTRELLAYLVHKHGSMASSGEIRAVLWEGAEDDHATNNYFQQIKRDLHRALQSEGVDYVFISQWNSYGIDPAYIECDYYHYLEGENTGLNAYNGEYMAQYLWGEARNTLLLEQAQRGNTPDDKK